LDDIKPLPAIPRLITQILVIGLMVTAMPDTIRLLPDTVPLSAERVLAGLALLWFVNLVNFMDGIDWITAAELLPVWLVVLVLALWANEPALVVLSAILIGSYLGFVPFNRPVASLFLGDVGSLPLGLVTGWLLYRIGATHGIVCALLPPLYYLADATITMVRRALRGEKIWEAHRSHFYQQATTNGLTVLAIVTRIVITNLALAGLALLASSQSLPVSLALLAIGGLCVTALIRNLQSDRRKP
jgi:UDP-N-acetylmuramyl pentapeptide phosphotransferase/UDP-N-acetylglucosamine-1-phosphate transferase